MLWLINMTTWLLVCVYLFSKYYHETWDFASFHHYSDKLWPFSSANCLNFKPFSCLSSCYDLDLDPAILLLLLNFSVFRTIFSEYITCVFRHGGQDIPIVDSTSVFQRQVDNRKCVIHIAEKSVPESRVGITGFRRDRFKWVFQSVLAWIRKWGINMYYLKYKYIIKQMISYNVGKRAINGVLAKRNQCLSIFQTY